NKTNPGEVIEAFRAHPRIRVVRIADGFDTNTSLFNYARFLGHKRGDMYEVGLFEEMVGMSGDDVMFAINIPQESVVIPETMDGIRASLRMQEDRLEAVGITNKYLGMV
ncbi:MAG: type II glyceraldehyde-3-phosphate dehydrogenase, partial [Acidimicrobiia bacterium]